MKYIHMRLHSWEYDACHGAVGVMVALSEQIILEAVSGALNAYLAGLYRVEAQRTKKMRKRLIEPRVEG